MTNTAKKIALSPDASTEAQPQRLNGKFVKGHKKVGGRGHGSKNKFPKSVKSLVLEGIGDIARFVENLKATNPSVAAALLGKTFTPGDFVPQQVGTGGKIGEVRIIEIPSGHFFEQIGERYVLVPPRDAWELANPGLPYPIITAAPTEPQRTIDHASRAELTFAGAARSQSDLAERVPVEPEPAPEPDPVMQRAREMGYTPLPKRIRLVD